MEIYRPFVESSHISFELEVPVLEGFRNRIMGTAHNFPFLIYEGKGEILGYAYASVFRERAAYSHLVESSIYLSEKIRGTGAGQALYNCLFDLLALMGKREIIAVSSIPNPLSIAFHEKMDFEKSGMVKRAGFKFGRFWDIQIMQRSIEQSPHTIMNWTELKRTEKLVNCLNRYST